MAARVIESKVAFHDGPPSTSNRVRLSPLLLLLPARASLVPGHREVMFPVGGNRVGPPFSLYYNCSMYGSSQHDRILQAPSEANGINLVLERQSRSRI